MKDLPTILVTLGIGALLGALAATPQLLHAMDSGHAEAKVEELGTTSLSSRNVALTGTLREDLLVELTTTTKRKGRVESVHTDKFYPLVGAAFQPKDAVKVVVQVDDYPRLLEVLKKGQPVTLAGTLRSAAWEGLPGKVKDAFVNGGQPLADDVLLLEFGKPHDTWKAFGYPFIGLAVAALTIWTAKSKQKK